ncbi:acetylxylan esterase [Dyadobacter sp. CY327]|uniref:acetylxylan esterase n=1 Tax=Dyadobacter sp. CY327 TaxID=2907301 RepID=UPI001F3CF1F5|nr:acetylxylan esterase [Dyadobacter sp. CY327]MCE7070853.1 acetylxylan esterase [Dyadobacter sp. CY327]
MKYNAFIFSTCCFLGLSSVVSAQEDLSVYNYWKYYQKTTDQLFYNELSSRAFGQLEKREAAIAALATKEQWQKRQAEVRAKLAKSVGPFPEKTPLNPVIAGTLKKQDFTVEKLYYESRPGYHVTAAMFIPDKRQEKAPAIIFCSGHAENGFRSEAYQHMILNYVKKGFIVLAFDPIGQGERIQYQPDELKKGATGEHSYAGAQTFIAGLPAANYFIWDGIRSVDYLLSRKEVDPARIGIAGRSGGGTQTAYIAAMDDRILAAAPECYITTFDKLIRSNGPQDAEQNLMYGLENGIDMADFLEVRAPKPALIVATTRDMFAIQGARDSYHETKKAYQAFGKAEQIQMTEDDAGHASTLKNREATYAFFQKYLNNPGSPTDLKVEILTDKELHASPEGRVIPFLKGESMFSLNEKYAKELAQKRQNNRKQTADFHADLKKKVISISGFKKFSGKTDVVFSGRMHRSNYAIEKYLVKGSGGYYIPVLWLKPEKASGKTVLLLNEGGKTEAVQKDKLADRLAREGYEVVVPDLSGTGELGSGFLKGGDSVIDEVPLNLWFTGVLTHKSLLATRTEEIVILADFIQKSGTPKTMITGAAVGTLTSDLLHAAAIANPFNKLVLIRPLISYQSIVEERLYKAKFALSAVPGALAGYDLPDLVEVLSAQGLLLINPITATEKEVDQEHANSIYKQALKQTRPGRFGIKQGLSPDETPDAVMSWIK